MSYGRYRIPPEIQVLGGPPARVEDSKFWLFGLESSSNHIRDWRRMQFLLAAEETLSATRTDRPDLDEFIDLRIGSGRAASRASMFNPHEGVHRFTQPVQYLSHLIGIRTFQAIYSATPPAALIDYTIGSENKQRYEGWPHGPQLEQVTIEALHGRITWEDRFADAGAPTPEEYIQTATELYMDPRTNHYEGWI